MYDEIPLNCSSCGFENMVNLLYLEYRPYSNIEVLRGYTCENCGMWELVSVETTATIELLYRIAKARVGTTKYANLMAKALRKNKNLVDKIRAEMLEDGKSYHNHQTSPDSLG